MMRMFAGAVLPLVVVLSAAPVPTTPASPTVACLPAGMPALETLQPIGARRLHIVVGLDDSNDDALAVLVARTYQDTAGHAWNVATIRGSVVLVDDHPRDDDATDWWVDGGMLSDDIPPRLQATPTSTCRFHRRGDRM